MQLLIRICLILSVSTVFAGGSSGVSGGSGGGPGQVLLVKNNGSETSISDNFKYNTSGPGVGGGGGNGGPGMTQPLRFLGGDNGNVGPVFTIKDVVDVRLTDDEVLDVQEFQDRFSEDVTKVGDDLRIAKKIPIADFQNMNGEVIRIQNIELRN